MLKQALQSQRLVALFLFGCALFNYPLLYLFNRGSEWLGIPVLYTYIFIAWACLIAALAYLMEKAR